MTVTDSREALSLELLADLFQDLANAVRDHDHGVDTGSEYSAWTYGSSIRDEIDRILRRLDAARALDPTDGADHGA